jgi:hypothetical protein
LGAVLWAAPAGQSWADTTGVPLDQLLSDIQKVLINVRDASDTDALPAMTAVNVTLRGTLSRQADGSLKFYILEASAHVTDESVQELRLQLGPPEPSDKSPVSASAAPLADAIIDAARNVKRAANRDPPLHLVKLEASIEFTVEKEASGSIVLLGGKAGRADTQQITLVFSEKR